MRNARIATLIVLFIATGNLLSCSESDIGTGNNSEPLTIENATAVAAKNPMEIRHKKYFRTFRR